MPTSNTASFQAFLDVLARRFTRQDILLVLDRAPNHCWVRSSAGIWLFASTSARWLLRQIDIKSDHIMQFVDEVGIIREFELPNAMRLQPVRAPDALPVRRLI